MRGGQSAIGGKGGAPSSAAFTAHSGARVWKGWGVLCLALLALLLPLLAAAGADAAPNYPELTGRIVDNAHLISADDRAAIESELTSLEATSTDQIAVVTVPSLDGYPIEDYGIGLARKWQIGQKDKDNGIVLLIAPNERKVRIEVGRRLEPLMTDTMSSLIVQNAILPKFRRGDFSGGIRDGVRDIKAVLLGDAEEVKNRARIRAPENDPTAIIQMLLFMAIVLYIFWQIRRAAIRQREWEASLTPEQRRALRRRRGYGGPIIIPGGSGDWGGGWSGGGGGGGWSGGGGDFGGGGATGSL